MKCLIGTFHHNKTLQMSGLRNKTNLNEVFTSFRRFSSFSHQAKENPYETLGVPPTATQDEIKKAYHKLSFIQHPDRNNGSKESHRKFTKLTAAYKLLSDVDERRRFDKNETMAREFSRGFTPHVRTNTNRRVYVKSSRKIYDFERFNAGHYPRSFYEEKKAHTSIFPDEIDARGASRMSMLGNVLILWGATATLVLYLFIKQKKI